MSASIDPRRPQSPRNATSRPRHYRDEIADPLPDPDSPFEGADQSGASQADTEPVEQSQAGGQQQQH